MAVKHSVEKLCTELYRDSSDCLCRFYMPEISCTATFKSQRHCNYYHLPRHFANNFLHSTHYTLSHIAFVCTLHILTHFGETEIDTVQLSSFFFKASVNKICRRIVVRFQKTFVLWSAFWENVNQLTRSVRWNVLSICITIHTSHFLFLLFVSILFSVLFEDEKKKKKNVSWKLNFEHYLLFVNI